MDMLVSKKKNDNKLSFKGRSYFQLVSLEKSPIFYLLPVVLFMTIMIAYPIGRVVYLSFTQNILTRPDLGIKWIGIENYITLFSSLDFWMTLGRTSLWTGISVIGKSVIAFCIALLLSKEFAFKKFYMLLLMVPWVTPMVVASVVWKWIYDGEFGMLNYILMELNILSEPFAWLGHKTSAFFMTIIPDMWTGIPFLTMLFLAGIQSIPVELNESASIDGANGFQKLIHITLPNMKHIILVATTLSGIWTFNSFGIIWPLTQGGPVDATQTLIIQAYKKSFGSFDVGMGSAIAMVIFLILLTFTVIYSKLLSSQEE